VADITLTPLAVSDVPDLYAFERENRAWFERFVPPRPDAYWQHARLAALVRTQVADPDAMFLIRVGGALAGRLNLTDFEVGVAQLGYRVGKAWGGRGVASAAVALGLERARGLGLRAVEARARADNPASVRVLEKCGFVLRADGAGWHLGRRAPG